MLVAWVQATILDLNEGLTVPTLWHYTLNAIRDTLKQGYFHPK